MPDIWTFHTAVKLVFGQSALGRLGELTREIGARRVLVATDSRLMDTGLVERVRAPLQDAGVAVEIFSGGEPEPSFRAAEACIESARDLHPDAILGLGGGSNLDLAKVAATVLAHGGTLRQYVGENKVPGPIWPLICVPTTAGTGSEVSAAAVLTDSENKVKVGILSNYLRAKIALVDPTLTVSCPPRLTADSGIDALTHAIEAYTAVDNADFPVPAPGDSTTYQGRHPLGDCLAEKAISLIGTNLSKAVREGSNLAAREGMALGATLAGMAFSNVGVALVHALEYPVGGAVHCSHGTGNGLLLPYVMRFNLPARPKQFAAIARLLGKDVAGLDPHEAAEGAVKAVEKLREEIGIPSRLRDLGVQRSQLKGFAEKALSIKRILRVNPRPVTLVDLVAILEEAY
jgi:alcohol dehydrogenase class IV